MMLHKFKPLAAQGAIFTDELPAGSVRRREGKVVGRASNEKTSEGPDFQITLADLLEREDPGSSLKFLPVGLTLTVA